MKIRSDFVTNSSSSSFIIARKDEITEKEKEALVSFMINRFWGRKELTPESTEKEIQDFIDSTWQADEHEEEIRAALKAGKNIYSGVVYFEGDDDLSYLYQGAWNAMKQSNKDFEEISTDLEY